MAGHEGPRGFGPQDKWPYRDSGPSGSSDTGADLAWLAAHRDAESDLPLGQGEGSTPQGEEKWLILVNRQRQLRHQLQRTYVQRFMVG